MASFRLTLLLVLLTATVAVADVVSLEMESREAENVGMFGTAGSFSTSSFDWAAGEEELGDSAGTGTSHLTDMYTLGGYLDDDAPKMLLDNGDDKCWDSVVIAKTAMGTNKPSDFDTKFNAILRKICKDGFTSSDRPSCCPSDPDSTTAVPSCDASLCFLDSSNANGKAEKFGNDAEFPITVSSSTKYIQGDVTINLKKAGVCMKTGISNKPIMCHTEKSCTDLQLTIKTVCEESTFDDCYSSNGNRAANKWKGTGSGNSKVDDTTTAWETAKTAKAAVLTGQLCNAI